MKYIFLILVWLATLVSVQAQNASIEQQRVNVTGSRVEVPQIQSAQAQSAPHRPLPLMTA